MSDKLKLFDQYIHGLIKRFYLKPWADGFGTEVSSGELFVCNVLGRNGMCTMSELAEECCLASSSMTGLVDRLVAKGCVKRSRDAGADRRKVFVELDRKGAQAYQMLLESEMEIAITMMEALKPQEQDVLLEALGKAVEALERR